MKMKQMNHSEYYELTTEEQEKYVEYIKRKINREKKEKPLFEEMMKIVENKVERYKTDFFVHDINSMTMDLKVGNQFLWNTYDCGTRLVRFNSHFEEEANSIYEDFKVLLKGYFLDPKSKNYLINIKEQTVKEIDPTTITADFFTNSLGSVNDYFQKQLNTVEPDKIYECNRGFKELSDLYRGHPPKEKVDEIFSEAKKKNKYVLV